MAVLSLSMTNVHSGTIACDTVIGLPDLILKNLGREGVEGERYLLIV